MLIKEKVSQAIGILKEMNIDCWITFVRESQLNGDPILDFLVTADLTWHSALIVTASGDTRAIVGLYDKKTVEDTGAYRHVEGYVESIKKPMLDYLRKLKPRTIAINFSKDSEICDGLTHGMYLTIVEYLSEIGFEKKLVSAEGVISALRQRKTPTEIKHMKEAIRITEEIFKEVAPYIAPGRTEHEIAEFMKKEVKKRGVELAWGPTTCPSVFTGPDTAGAHYNPTERKVKRGHVLNMDFGIKYMDYCSDLQRTFYVLEKGEQKAPPEVQKGFNTIVECVESSRQAMKPGVKGNDVDIVSRSVLRKHGYEEFPHALGHQVGRFPHDGTAILGPAWEKYGRKPFIPLEKGMVFTIEPRLTVPDRGVATIEEMVVLTARGAEYISTPQKKLLLIRS